MNKLLFASKNKGKIYEVKSFLKDIIEVISLEEIEISDNFEVVEKGNTLEKIPIGISTFSQIIKEDYLYIDKTEEAYEVNNQL